MPPLPTITDVFRIKLNWNATAGVTPVNVFHVRVPSATASQVATTISGSLLSASGRNPFEVLSNGYICTTMQITPLDGHSAGTDHGFTTALVGSGSGELINAGAAVVSFKTTQRGSRGRGRMFIGPITEDKQGGGVINNTAQGHMALGWGDFINNIQTQSVPGTMVIASYVHQDAHDVTTVRVDNLLGTVRGRQDQLR